MCSAAVKTAAASGKGQGNSGKQQPLSCRLAFVSLLFFTLLFVGCTSTAPVIKVGLVGPFEGAGRAIGYDVIYSARLAVREINAAGGIGGYRVALVALDDSGDPQLAQAVAASLTIDPAVVVVIGHWLTPTTAVAAPIYAAANLPFLPAGQPPIGQFLPEQLPPAFHTAYQAVTPFDETPGPYAGPAYDGMQLLWQALAAAAQQGEINRTAVAAALEGLSYVGMTGVVSRKP